MLNITFCWNKWELVNSKSDAQISSGSCIWFSFLTISHTKIKLGKYKHTWKYYVAKLMNEENNCDHDIPAKLKKVLRITLGLGKRKDHHHRCHHVSWSWTVEAKYKASPDIKISCHFYSDQSTQWCCPTTALAVFLGIILLPYSQIAHSLVVDCLACSRYVPAVSVFLMSDSVDDSLLFVQLL